MPMLEAARSSPLVATAACFATLRLAGGSFGGGLASSSEAETHASSGN